MTKPSMRITAGHLSKIFVKVVMIEDINRNRQQDARKNLETTMLSYKVHDQTINSLSDKALILGTWRWSLLRAAGVWLRR
jgi:hypothetical protein